MIRRPYYKYTVAVLVAGPAVVFGLSNSGCSAASSGVANVQAALSGCSEFSGGPSSVAALSIDGDAKAFVIASANLVAVASTSETAVLNACLGMAADLHITDTWSSMAPSSGDAPDAETAEVCTQVSNTITATLAANASAGCTLVISGGHCVVNETEQVTCHRLPARNWYTFPPLAQRDAIFPRLFAAVAPLIFVSAVTPEPTAGQWRSWRSRGSG